MKKRVLAMVLASALCLGLAACQGEKEPETGIYTAGTYEASAQGYGGAVKVTMTFDANNVTDVKIEGADETAGIGSKAIENLPEVIKNANGGEFDGESGATITSGAIKEAVAACIAKAKGEAAEGGELSYTAGTYTGTGKGYNGPVSLSVTFSDTAITAIEVGEQKETAHVGDSAFPIMIADAIAANGSGIDAVSGATFSSRAFKEALNDAATQAKATNMEAFKANTVAHTAQAAMDLTYDVVIVGAGGAGLAAGAQAAQNGDSVIILEKNAEMGGNTLVAGGSFQAYVPYLCWDPENPDATTGHCDYDGKDYDKVKTDAGRLEALKTILTWSEEPFDGTVDADHPFVAGDIALNAKRGVHAEYLETLKTLKKQIQAYVTWADKKIAAGAKETDLPVFSTNELHLFQTYYGGLRPNADNTEWIYSDIELASQFVDEALETKYWLMDQGANVALDTQGTLIGCLWQRINSVRGGTVNGVEYNRNWGAYFAVPENTILTANADNQIMTRTTAKELIMDGSKVTGVKAVQYDGTEVTIHANKGVILATGGYGANIKMVQETNEYWDPSFIADNIGTTNRNSLTGDGIVMGQAAGAAVTGMGWTQMMPLGWVDNGNLSGGAGENVMFIDPNTGKRYVDESAERDVLSLGGFQHSMTKELAEELGLKYVPGIYVEFSNAGNAGDPAVAAVSAVEGRTYYWTTAEIAEKLHLDEQTVIDTITEYDNFVMGVTDSMPVEKLSYRGTVGTVEQNEDGTYKPETYNLGIVRVRFMAPSTHHTMGGLVVDTDRHVLNESGDIIEGLYAAGEVTGGFMGGNRLGGNAITEILVSGRIAANTISADNK